MTKTGVLFIAQNMVIGQHGNTVILLRVQTTDPRQPVANADLKPGLIEPVLQLAEDRIAQIVGQRAELRAAYRGSVIERCIFPGE